MKLHDGAGLGAVERAHAAVEMSKRLLANFNSVSELGVADDVAEDFLDIIGDELTTADLTDEIAEGVLYSPRLVPIELFTPIELVIDLRSAKQAGLLRFFSTVQ